MYDSGIHRNTTLEIHIEENFQSKPPMEGKQIRPEERATLSQHDGSVYGKKRRLLRICLYSILMISACTQYEKYSIVPLM